MTGSAGWDARAVVAQREAQRWQGRVWRAHRRVYAATDHGGSLRFSARYNRGSDQFPEDQVWAALYLALGAEVPLGEILRHISPEDTADLNEYRLSERAVELAAVLDCREATALGLGSNDLIRDYDFTATQEITAAAMAQGAVGILVP